MDRLKQGDLLPKMITAVPGPKSLALSESIRRVEAPGINTLYQDRPNIFWQSALGSNVLDVDGNRYIDLTAGFGVASVGHRHPKIVEAIQVQSDVLIHALGDAIGHPCRIELAGRLARLSPIPETRVYFAISGADAVEIAIKTALLAHEGRRSRILTFQPSYHGLTLGALNLSSRPEFKVPFSPHLHTQIHRLPFGCSAQEIDTLIEQLGDFAAVVVEPVVGREGVIPPPRHWLNELAQSCKRHGALLIADEIFTGFGRTGRWLAIEHDDLVPDLICCGKAMAGGMPIAAVLGSEKHMSYWKTSGEALHTATFVAHPIACAAALATLDVLESERLPQKAAALGPVIASRIHDWPNRFNAIRAVRGLGLFWGIELTTSELGGLLGQECWRRGILILVGGPDGCVAQIVPPLTISDSQLHFALDVLEDIFQRLSTP